MAALPNELVVGAGRASSGNEGLRTIGGIRFAVQTCGYSDPEARRVSWTAQAKQAGQPVGVCGTRSLVADLYLKRMEWGVGDLIPVDIIQRSTATAVARLPGCAQELFVDDTDVMFLFSGGAYQGELAMLSHLTIFTPVRYLNRLVAGYQALGWTQVDSQATINGCQVPAVDCASFDAMLIGMPNYGSEELRAQVVEQLARCLNDADSQMVFADKWSAEGSPGETFLLDLANHQSPEGTNCWCPGGQMRVALLRNERDVEPPPVL